MATVNLADFKNIDEAKLYADINEKFNIAAQARMPYERDWKMDIAFYADRQWVVYDPTQRRVVDYTPQNKKPRLTANLIKPVVRMEFARLTRNDPVFTVVSTTGDRDDVAKAKASRKFLEWLWSVKGWNKVFREALLWALVTGNGFVKVFWDPTAGPVVKVDDTVQTLGDVAIDYVSPFELFIDPFARSLDEAAWVIQARLRPVEYVKEKYGVSVTGDGEAWRTMVDSVFGPTAAYSSIPLSKTVLVKEYWEKPSTEYPRGRYAVVAGGKVLYASDNPYAATCPIPFVHMKHLSTPGHLYANSNVKPLRPINVVYNKLRSDIIENSAKLSTPPLIAPINSLLKDPQFEPGEVIYYNPLMGGVVQPLTIEPYPAHVVNVLLRLWQERDDISGVSEVSRGTVPRNIRSAAAMAYLLENDETRMNVLSRNWEEFIGKALNYALWLARQFYTVPRVLRVLGDNATWETMLFKASDVPIEADVRVEPGSTLPKSEIYQQEFLMQLWAAGVITDPRLLLRLTKFGNMEEIYNDMELDTQQAQRENNKMANGEPAQVEDYQNHAIHILEHNRFRKTVQYEELPPERKEVFRQHVAEHEAYMQLLAQRSQMMAQTVNPEQTKGGR